MAELIDRQLLNVRQAVRRRTVARADDSDHDRGARERDCWRRGARAVRWADIPRSMHFVLHFVPPL